MAEPKTIIVDENYHWGTFPREEDLPAVVIYRAEPESFCGKWFDSSITGPGFHVIIDDGVKMVETIRAGYITIGKDVETIKHMDNSESMREKSDAPINVPEYQLPLRIDFQSPVPPTVEKVSNSSISLAEIRVPSGALDAYRNHKQWRKAAYIMDADGNIVDNYAERHKQRLEDMRRAQEAEVQKAKLGKVAELGAMTHSMLAPVKLAKWTPTNIKTGRHDFFNTEMLFATVQVQNMTLQVKVPISAPLTIWAEVVARLEQLDQQLSSQ